MVGTSRFIVSKLCQLPNKSVGFDLKGFIETIIESVNAIVNTIFSSVSMDGSRMDRERDALMVGRVGGSMFKG